MSVCAYLGTLSWLQVLQQVLLSMFAVKATYRGQTRKLTFSGSNFPSFEELRNQVGLQLPHTPSHFRF